MQDGSLYFYLKVLKVGVGTFRHCYSIGVYHKYICNFMGGGVDGNILCVFRPT